MASPQRFQYIIHINFRSSKPSLISNRNFAGVWGTQKPGLTGLKNLGNTCYMNAAIQCVSNTKILATYFNSNCHDYELNRTNPLGYKVLGHI